MSQTPREKNLHLTLYTAVALATLVGLGGCLHRPVADDALVQAAFDERAAASIRLAKAITRLCSVTSETVTERDACIMDRRLSVSQLSPPQPIILSPVGSTSTVNR